MLVVAFSVTATTTGIAILGFHATVITPSRPRLARHESRGFPCDGCVCRPDGGRRVRRGSCGIGDRPRNGVRHGLRPCAASWSARPAFSHTAFFTGLPIGLATLIGTLVGAPLAIVGSTLFAGFGTLLLMQPRVLFATLVVALLLVLLALLLLDFRMFPTMFTRSNSRLSRPSNLAARRSARFFFGSNFFALSLRSSRWSRSRRSLRSDLNGLPPLSLPRSC